MSLSLRSFSTTVSAAVTAAQASCSQLLDVSIGSPARALMESVGGIGLWLQYLVLQSLLRTRLATSTGSDCDSFVNDFGMTRLPGTPATGLVTFTSFMASEQSAVVPPGVIVRTVGGISFVVTQDQSLPTWSASAGGYVRAADVSTLSVPVSCQVAGSAGNVSAGAICLMGTAVSGLDTVTNTAPFLNGSDQETDSQLRARFPLWLAAKASASRAAVGNAIANVQTDLSYSLRDGLDAAGQARSGYFTAVINDGSGVPSDQLLSEVYEVIDSVRALGVWCAGASGPERGCLHGCGGAVFRNGTAGAECHSVRCGKGYCVDDGRRWLSLQPPVLSGLCRCGRFRDVGSECPSERGAGRYSCKRQSGSGCRKHSDQCHSGLRIRNLALSVGMRNSHGCL